MLKEKYKTEIADILSRYPTRRSAVLPLLYLAQKEEGYVSEPAMKEIAGILRLTTPQVYEVVTFYTMFQVKPIGTFHIQVCKSLMCALVGSDTLLAWLKARLGIGPGEIAAYKRDRGHHAVFKYLKGRSVVSEGDVRPGIYRQGRTLNRRFCPSL